MTPQEKLIAEVRAALAMIPPGAVYEVEVMNAIDCIDDALTAYDQAGTETTDDKPEWPQE